MKRGVTLNLDKWQFSTDKVRFLRHAKRCSRIAADLEKLQAIADLLPSHNLQEVRTILGMLNQQAKTKKDKEHQ